MRALGKCAPKRRPSNISTTTCTRVDPTLAPLHDRLARARPAHLASAAAGRRLRSAERGAGAEQGRLPHWPGACVSCPATRRAYAARPAAAASRSPDYQHTLPCSHPAHAEPALNSQTCLCPRPLVLAHTPLGTQQNPPPPPPPGARLALACGAAASGARGLGQRALLAVLYRLRLSWGSPSGAGRRSRRHLARGVRQRRFWLTVLYSSI